MAENGKQSEPVLQEFRAIRGVLESMLIIACARTGMKREDLRAIVGVDNNRISRIARHVKSSGKNAEEEN